MNKLVFTSLLAALGGLVGSPATAKAGDDAWAAIGGFIGGVIVGSALDDHHGPSARVEYGRYSRHGGGRVIIETGGHHRGHWEWVEVRVWVPGRWVVSFDDCGRRYRRWASGYHDCRRERVWVDHHGRRDHDYERYAYDR